jgi:UDP-N-acetylmuramoylalanine--D-glutamate ligase
MRLVVLGGGESGVGTAILGKKKGYVILEKLKINTRR